MFSQPSGSTYFSIGICELSSSYQLLQNPTILSVGRISSVSLPWCHHFFFTFGDLICRTISSLCAVLLLKTHLPAGNRKQISLSIWETDCYDGCKSQGCAGFSSHVVNCLPEVVRSLSSFQECLSDLPFLFISRTLPSY